MFDFSLSPYDVKIMVTMGSIGLFVVGFISFMMYQEKRLKDLEDQAPED